MVERELTAIQLVATHFRVLGRASIHIHDRVATPSHAVAEALYTTENVLDIVDQPMLPGSDDEFLCDEDELAIYVHCSFLCTCRPKVIRIQS